MMRIFIRMTIVFFISALLGTSLFGALDEKDRVYILTEYLIKEKSKEVDAALKRLTPASPEYKALEARKKQIIIAARNEAIATVYGKPRFESLVYDDSSEMFFGRIVSEKGGFERDVNFYMPKQRARAFKKKIDDGRIEIEHAFEDDALVFKEIELSYAGVEYPLHVNMPNTFRLKLGGYFVGVQDTEVYTRKNGIGATLNLQKLFDLQEKVSVMRVSASYKFNPKHRVEASWYALRNSSSKQIDREIVFDGETYQAGAKMEVYMDSDIYKLNYVYSAYRTNKLELSFRVGLHITSIKTGLSAGYNLHTASETLRSDSVAVTAPLPVVGLGFDYEIMPKLDLNFAVDYFALSYDSKVSGAMSDSLLTVDYTFNRYVGIGGGLSRTQMRFKGRAEETEIGLRTDIAGIVGYMIFSY